MTQQTRHPRFGNQREEPYLIIMLLVLTLSQLILLHDTTGLHHHQDSIRSTLMAQQTTGEATLALELSLGTPWGPLLALLASSSLVASMQKCLKPLRCTGGSILLWKCKQIMPSLSLRLCLSSSPYLQERLVVIQATSSRTFEQRQAPLVNASSIT